MIKIYLDWNVMSQMKNGLHKELKEIMDQRNRFFLFYSTAHVSDLSSSLPMPPHITSALEEDLNFITQLTDDFCAYQHNGEIVIKPYSPKALMESQMEVGDVSKALNFEELSRPLLESSPAMAPLIEQLKTVSWENSFAPVLEDPEKKAQLEKYLPNLSNDFTMLGVLKSFAEMYKMLTEGDGYKGLREDVQTGLEINRDRLFDAKLPFAAIEQAYKKLNIKVPELHIQRQGPEWFDTIVELYVTLDMHGYQEDKVTISAGRKETFKNTTSDGQHAAFGSMADFYVSNDNKAYKKSQQVYEKLKINTIILKPEEFVEHYKQYLQIDSLEKHLSLFHYLLTSDYYEENVDEGRIHRTFYLPYFIFDYFNKINIMVAADKSYIVVMLSRSKPTNNSRTLLIEIEMLLQKLNQLFGKDIDDLGLFSRSEIEEASWKGRKWRHGGYEYSLKIINGYMQLYMDLSSLIASK